MYGPILAIHKAFIIIKKFCHETFQNIFDLLVLKGIMQTFTGLIVSPNVKYYFNRLISKHNIFIRHLNYYEFFFTFLRVLI